MGSYVPQVLAKTIESVKEATGIDITEIMKANTYDAKVNKNINISGIEPVINQTTIKTEDDVKAVDDVVSENIVENDDVF